MFQTKFISYQTFKIFFLNVLSKKLIHSFHLKFIVDSNPMLDQEEIFNKEPNSSQNQKR